MICKLFIFIFLGLMMFNYCYSQNNSLENHEFEIIQISDDKDSLIFKESDSLKLFIDYEGIIIRNKRKSKESVYYFNLNQSKKNNLTDEWYAVENWKFGLASVIKEEKLIFNVGWRFRYLPLGHNGVNVFDFLWLNLDSKIDTYSLGDKSISLILETGCTITMRKTGNMVM